MSPPILLRRLIPSIDTKTAANGHRLPTAFARDRLATAATKCRCTGYIHCRWCVKSRPNRETASTGATRHGANGSRQYNKHTRGRGSKGATGDHDSTISIYGDARACCYEAEAQQVATKKSGHDTVGKGCLSAARLARSTRAQAHPRWSQEPGMLWLGISPRVCREGGRF